MKNLCLLFSILFSLNCAYSQNNASNLPQNAQVPTKQMIEQFEKMSPEQKKKMEKEQLELSVESSMTALRQKVLKKDNNELFSTELQIYANDFLSYNKNPYIEEVTKIYREWYKKISECLTLMSKVKFQHKLAEMSKQQDDIAKLDKDFALLKEKLESVLKNPPKISQKKNNR